jgi:putative ABC transport system permease protein
LPLRGCGSYRRNRIAIEYSHYNRSHTPSRTIVACSFLGIEGQWWTTLDSSELAVTVRLSFTAKRLRVDSDLGVFGRLKPGVSLEQASAEMAMIMEGMGRQRPDRKDFGALLVPLESARVEYIRPALLLLLVAVGCVLLIACANVANLFLSRAVGRQREIAARVALGAGRGRLARQFLIESTTIALIGGAAGLVLAQSAGYGLMRFVPERIPVPNAADYVSLPKLHLEGNVLVFTLLISLLTGVLAGLLPVIQSLCVNVNDALKESSRGSPSSLRGNRMRATLVIVESAVCICARHWCGIDGAEFRSPSSFQPRL